VLYAINVSALFARSTYPGQYLAGSVAWSPRSRAASGICTWVSDPMSRPH